MKLKTYTAQTMAQALAQVRKDLGKDAMILHTRSYRVGAWFGIGGKNMVEITASTTSSPNKSKPPRAMPRVSQPTAQPVQEPTTRPTLQPLAQQRAVTQSIESKPLTRQDVPQHQDRAALEPEIVIQRGRTMTRQRLATTPTTTTSHSSHSSHSSSNGSTNIADDRGLQGRDALFADESNDKPKNERQRNPLQTPNRFETPSITSLVIPIPQADEADQTRPEPKATTAPKQTQPKPEQTVESKETNDQLRSQIDTLSKMMGQVLESTRKTAVAVGTNNANAAIPTGEMPAPLFALYAKLMDNDVPADLADTLVGSVRDRLDSIELKDPLIVRQALLREIESTIHTRSESLVNIDHHSSTGRPRVIALVGPTGVGKTTTVAKLAATYKLRHGKKVGLITSDTYRIAAVEQLRTYAGIIGLPLKVANSPEELARAIEELHDCDIVVVDTAGRSQNDARRLDELAEFTKAARPDETHLVLSTTVGDNVLRKTADRFKALGPDRCILTKLDEAVTTGPIAGLSDRIGLPLSFITVGQEVPDDLEPARVDRLARCVLDGPEAVVRRWSEEIG